MTVIPTIDVVNESTVYTDDAVQQLLVALQHQVSYDFRAHWDAPAKLESAASIGAGHWGLVISDDADQAGALGYHDLTADGLPLGKVFARTTIDDGGEVSVTASHELLEMLGDPWIDRAVQVGSQTFYALEVCDACEADQYAYPGVNGVMLSDFVLPRWFNGTAAGHNDFKRHISNAKGLLPGGYIGKWTPSTGWTQLFHSDGAPASRRTALRAKKWNGHGLVRSTR